jgi:hypothetical protein
MSTPQEEVQCVLWLAELQSFTADQHRSTVHNVLHKRLRLRAYRIQMIHALKPSDQVARTSFAVDMLERIDASLDFLRHVCFSDEEL